MTGDQVELFPADAVDHTAGAVERATLRALQAARLDPTTEGAGRALLTAAWSLDAARAAGKFYGVAQALPPFQALYELVLGRPAGGDPDAVDPADTWLRALTGTALGDAPDA